MKKIRIYQRDAQVVELLDDSDMDFDEYCKEISKVFQVSNITILKTTTQTFIGRPSQLTGLTVENVDSKLSDDLLLIDNIENEIEDIDNIEEENQTIDQEEDLEQNIKESQQDTQEEKVEIQEDIITDMD
jgi:hypothetical protein